MEVEERMVSRRVEWEREREWLEWNDIPHLDEAVKRSFGLIN